MVCLASRGSAKKLLRKGTRFAGRLATDWCFIYVEMPDESPDCIKPESQKFLYENIALGTKLGGKYFHLKGKNVADELVKFAREHSITHVICGQSARTRREIFWKDSIINRFLSEVTDASVQVVRLGKKET